ncbi:MAG: hypothetical protein KY395_03560 [Actinobacteria bacterium]|nr:hypothetical protein [Actinomycetota bacterium]
MLGGITSLPEVSTTATAAAIPNPSLAASNVFGSVSTNLLILAVADFASPTPLVLRVPMAAVIRQGLVALGVLFIAGAGIILGDPFGGSIGIGPLAIAAIVIVSFVLMGRIGAAPPAADEPDVAEDLEEPSLLRIVLKLAGVGLVVVVAGAVAAQSADAFAEDLGLASGFVGFVLLAVVTSLPEVSATIGAVRVGLGGLAAANIFGSNMFNVALLAVADLSYTQGPLLDALGSDVLLSLALATALIAAYLAALRWPGRTIGRIGIGSAVVIAGYVVGAGALARLG